MNLPAQSFCLQTDAMEEGRSSKTPAAKISGGSPLISARMTSRSQTSVHSKKSDISHRFEFYGEDYILLVT